MNEMTPEERELAELRARRAAVADRRARFAAQEAERAALDAELRAVEDEEAIARLEEEHGPVDRAIAVVQTDLGAVIVKRVKPPLFKRFSDQIGRENAKAYEVSEALVMPALLYPTRERFAVMVEQQPFVMIRAANAIAVLAGVRGQEVAGK